MPKIEQYHAPDDISYSFNSPQWIVVHYTATNASAYNNAVYFSRGGNWNSSAHYFLDGTGIIYQSVPDNRGAWHAGNYNCNTHSIGIEVVSDGRDFTTSEIDELTWLVQSLMSKYGIPAERVIRHHDVADHFAGYTVDPYKNCPAPYVNNAKWQALKETIIGDDEMTNEQIKLLAQEIAKAQADYAYGNDKKGNFGVRGKGNASRCNYNVLRWCQDLLISIDAKLDTIIKKMG